MVLDLPTLFVACMLVAGLSVAICVATWLQDRQQDAMLWMAGCCFLGGAGTLLRFELPERLGILSGNLAFFLAFASLWAASRVVDGRRPSALPFLLPCAIWILAFWIPGFAESLRARIVLASILDLMLVATTMIQFWSKRRSEPPARWMIVGLLAFQSLLLVGRIIRTGVASGAGLSTQALYSLGLVALTTIGFSLMVTFAMILLVKERAERQHRSDAETDGLTGLPNRRLFDKAMPLAYAKARQTGNSLALLMIDVDAFKRFNDHHGHPAGDACLRTVATTLAAGVRPGDITCRYGGEEFAVILPQTGQVGAMAIAERLRLAIRALALPHGDADDKSIVTISLGCAAAAPCDAPDVGSASLIAELLRAADQALYLAKTSGRDATRAIEVVSAEPVMPQPLTCLSAATAPLHAPEGPRLQ
ncbi:GGDEF domain-containing protein [Lichenihabitans sp. PAMC28606]|uniref:GGDEF domain-containing protein n=1 Tax=Lichenihabitans sp. PAMC28606 TaxID=2880932 RepID=UPI001D0A9876|nr:GGDEF domain-containing protein [Lichenihabitans sp. PAMC28606]UDL93334.1 GGDEF domain-containing protein [Lichenihabitans sp. PAMC28606]